MIIFLIFSLTLVEVPYKNLIFSALFYDIYRIFSGKIVGIASMKGRGLPQLPESMDIDEGGKSRKRQATESSIDAPLAKRTRRIVDPKLSKAPPSRMKKK